MTRGLVDALHDPVLVDGGGCPVSDATTVLAEVVAQFRPDVPERLWDLEEVARVCRVGHGLDGR